MTNSAFLVMNYGCCVDAFVHYELNGSVGKGLCIFSLICCNAVENNSLQVLGELNQICIHSQSFAAKESHCILFSE